MTWVEVWMIWRLAIISQGIAARVQRGQASSAEAKEAAGHVGLLGRIGLGLLRGGDGGKKDRGQAKL